MYSVLMGLNFGHREKEGMMGSACYVNDPKVVPMYYPPGHVFPQSRLGSISSNVGMCSCSKHSPDKHIQAISSLPARQALRNCTQHPMPMNTISLVPVALLRCCCPSELVNPEIPRGAAG